MNKIIQIDFNNQPAMITGFAYLFWYELSLEQSIYLSVALTLQIIIKGRKINKITKQKADQR